MEKKLILIDGNSIINRAFFALPDSMTNAEGLHTNAIYGFLNIMFRILKEENGDYLCIAFDVHAPTFRHKMYPEYKGTRKGMPEELKEQVPVLKKLLHAMGILTLEKAGYEADDILGTLAKKGERDGLKVTLVSGDRDLLQIATDNILIRIPKTKGGKTEIEDYHTKDVIDKYGLEPLQIIELKGLMGDSSDNIPGVPKIGEKTATQLLLEYHDIDNLSKHIDEISKNSIRTALKEHFDMAVMSKTLATIDINADIDFDYTKAVIGNLYTEEAYVIVKELGFKNILKDFEAVSSNAAFDFEDKIRIIYDFNEAESLFERLKSAQKASFAFCYDKAGYGKQKRVEIYGLAICCTEEEIDYIPINGFITAGYLQDRFADAVISSKAQMITFDLKSQLPFLEKIIDAGIISSRFTDIFVGAYLCNPLKNDYEINDIAGEYASVLIKSKEELFPKGSILKYAENEDRDKGLSYYAGSMAYICLITSDVIAAKIDELKMTSLFKDIEMPLIECLYDMEKQGILVIPDELSRMSEELSGEMALLEKDIYKEAGEEFNINSPVQLGNILFDKLEIPGGKKTKKGYSTAADVLEKLAPSYPIVSLILKYRALSKLKSTYTDGLMQFISDDRRIHSTFNQTITATGRISSTDPNLQNIPVRMEQGRLIRKAFVPREGCLFIDADYSQIELRIMAHLSSDPQMIEAFNSGADIHAITASKVFKVPLSEVTSDMRRNAKAVNFGIIYGISPYGLANDIGISTKEAKEFISQYFETFPGVKTFLDGTVEAAKENGYVSTLYGRRRPLPEISSSNFMTRSFGERVAMNAPIQGTAADIMKIAMINVNRRLLREGLKSRIILQVHDELLIEAYEDEKEKVAALLKEEMEGAIALKVPMPVETSVGNNWYEAK